MKKVLRRCSVLGADHLIGIERLPDEEGIETNQREGTTNPRGLNGYLMKKVLRLYLPGFSSTILRIERLPDEEGIETLIAFGVLLPSRD